MVASPTCAGAGKSLPEYGLFQSRHTSRESWTVTTFHNILATLDPDVLDRAVRTWAEQRSRSPAQFVTVGQGGERVGSQETTLAPTWEKYVRIGTDKFS